MVSELRKRGWKVKVTHNRVMTCSPKIHGERVWLSYAVPTERGGHTVVELTTPEGKNVTGLAVCSRNDNYDKKQGVKIALGRALASLKDGTDHNAQAFKSLQQSIGYSPQSVQ